MDRYVIPTIFGQDIGIIVEGKNGVQFQYNDAFDGKLLPLSPILLPYDKERVYTVHDAMAFNGLPGIFNDSLPDRFGSILMNKYFSRKYGSANRLSVIDKLLYIGSEGMGAIEYQPATNDTNTDGIALREYINTTRDFLSGKSEEIISELTRHPSPGGAKPKAAVKWNRKDNIMSVGNISENVNYNEDWIVKFDEDGKEETLVEYCYMNLAKSAGINIPDTEIININDENHFAIKRFDRRVNGEKLHLATMAGLLHLDFNTHVSTSYEECMQTALFLTHDHHSIKEIYRRMVINIIGRNCDDHSKNTSFLMDKTGEWKVSPAYDLVYNYGQATFGQHRMSIAGKIDNIKLNDLAQCGYAVGLDTKFMKETIVEISDLFSGISTKLLNQGVSKETAKEIEKNICQFSTTGFPLNSKDSIKKDISRRTIDSLTEKIIKKVSTPRDSGIKSILDKDTENIASLESLSAHSKENKPRR